MRPGAGHIGGEMSVIDILTALYFHVLRVDPDKPLDPARDRFVLSKGHTACALYVTLAEKGVPSERRNRDVSQALFAAQWSPQSHQAARC